MTTLTSIEKAAKLMGYEPLGTNIYGVFEVDKQPENKQPHTASTFNPYTSKSDLSDVIDELGIDVEWNEAAEYVFAAKRNAHREYLAAKFEYSKNHSNKFTARAHAVMAVVEQIYDARFGKDGE